MRRYSEFPQRPLAMLDAVAIAAAQVLEVRHVLAGGALAVLVGTVNRNHRRRGQYGGILCKCRSTTEKTGQKYDLSHGRAPSKPGQPERAIAVPYRPSSDTCNCVTNVERLKCWPLRRTNAVESKTLHNFGGKDSAAAGPLI